MTTTAIKRGILLFWTLWLGLVAGTNLFSLLKARGLIGAGWPFASNNFALVRTYMATYHSHPTLTVAAFAGVVLWEWLAAALFASSFLHSENRRTAQLAFGVSLGLWAAFLLAGEFFLHYELEAFHMEILTAQLASLLAVRLLPEP